MIKIIFTKNEKIAINKLEGEAASVEATVVANHPLAARIGHALRIAPSEHRIATFLIFVAGWVVLEYYFHAEKAAHAAEVFGVTPFMDRVLKIFLREAE